MAPAITITSEELRERVEEHLGRWIPDSLWERSEPYARRKLDLCRERSPEICLIYISAYLEFAPEGYTVQAFRYILKRDLERMLPSCLEALFHEKIARSRKVLTIRQNRTSIELPYDSIYCLESDLRKVNVYGDVPHQPLCSYYGKLTDLPQALFENGFLRVGRSDVVNMRYIRQISGYKVTMRNGAELSVSRNGYAAIRETYLEWKGQFGDE